MALVRPVRFGSETTKSYLDDEAKKDLLVAKVLEGLLWRLTREPEPIGCPVLHLDPPRYLVTKSYRLPIPRLLRMLYYIEGNDLVIEFAQIADLNED